MAITKNKIKTIIRRFKARIEYKWWRIDLNMWEEKIVFFWFISYYRYSIWEKGSLRIKIRFFKYLFPKYMKKPMLINYSIYLDNGEE